MVDGRPTKMTYMYVTAILKRFVFPPSRKLAVPRKFYFIFDKVFRNLIIKILHLSMFMSNAIANTSKIGQVVYMVVCGGIYMRHCSLCDAQNVNIQSTLWPLSCLCWPQKNNNQTEQFHLGSGNAKKRNTKSMFSFFYKIEKRMDDIIKWQRRW